MYMTLPVTQDKETFFKVYKSVKIGLHTGNGDFLAIPISTFLLPQPYAHLEEKEVILQSFNTGYLQY
jgi:hypothetical protein